MSRPIQPSEILFPYSTSNNINRTLTLLQKSKLSISNRLHCIVSDSDFITSIAGCYSLPLIANERCGSWYVPPSHRQEKAYFKSTDGHCGVWKFSLRRLNTQVFDVLARAGGAVLVDSTRRGKEVPDSFLKTVPIWCAVFNRLLFPEKPEEGRVRVPRKWVGASEESQIQERVAGWAEELGRLGLDVGGLRGKLLKPMRPVWVTRETELPESPLEWGDEDFSPIVLCTASKRVLSEEGTESGYVQGAGDDAESWACGLTPDLFWRHKDELLGTGEDDLPGLIAKLVREDSGNATAFAPILVRPTNWLYVGTLGCVESVLAGKTQALITICPRTDIPSTKSTINTHLHLECRDNMPKLGSRDLRKRLPLLQSFIQQLDKNSRLFICCKTGKDFSAGAALACLCLYAADDGARRGDGEVGTTLDKAIIKQRLSWIMTSHPSASPSRTTLQSVNDFLLTRREQAVICNRVANNSFEIPKTIFCDLDGKWRWERSIIDDLSGESAVAIHGSAVFTVRAPPAGSNAQLEYLYEEKGKFASGHTEGLTVSRRWVWRLRTGQERNTICIDFVKADGVTADYLYNELVGFQVTSTPFGELHTASAEHPCGRDYYKSSYSFELREHKVGRWVVRHDVEGPTKSYSSTTTYSRG